jgi:hypothetical protein
LAKTKKAEQPKICFVISPIGKEKSETRDRSDQVLDYIVKPTIQELGYEVVRADSIAKPGIITSQVIDHLIDDSLVVADLSGHNPNVFYELAIRHATRLPVVQLIQDGEAIPFDVSQSRTIYYDLHDLRTADDCRKQLAKQVRAVEKNPSDVDSPVSVAVDLKLLRGSQNLVEKSNADILGMLQDIRFQIHDLRVAPRAAVSPASVDAITGSFSRLIDILSTENNPDKKDEMLNILGRLMREVHDIFVRARIQHQQYHRFMQNIGLLRRAGLPRARVPRQSTLSSDVRESPTR